MTKAAGNALIEPRVGDAAVSHDTSGLAAIDTIDIAWEKFRLSNGLTVIVAENRAVPLVAVNIWYKVGAKDEVPNKTGLAHLFEHLMFGGSANMPGSYLGNMGQLGALDLNGTTNLDRTNFYQTVQTGALDAVLFAESDRMGHFLDTLGPDVLEQQRGVVLNEKRQTEGAPYGLVHECMVRGMYPPGHPYAHTTLGWQADIESLTLADARDWFRNHYCPSNAVLVLAGDIDVATAREKAAFWFGHISPGPVQRRPARWVPSNTPPRREVLEDRVSSARLIMAWHVPPAGDMDATRLTLAAPLLGGGASSLLHRRLVDERKIALSVSMGIAPMLLSGQAVIAADVPAGGDLRAVEAEIKAVLATFMRDGPSESDIACIKIEADANLVRQYERSNAVADLLAMNEVYFGDPGYWRGDMERFAKVTADDVRATTAAWLNDEPAYTLDVVARPAYEADHEGADRTASPVVDAPPGIALPPIREARLSNGMRVLVAERRGLPLVECRLILPRGLTLEPRGRMGLGTLTAGLMSRGIGNHDAEALRALLQTQAISQGVHCGLDFSGARTSALTSKLGIALDLLADLVRRPRFDGQEFERARTARLDALKNADAAPAAAAGRVLAGLMFGDGHPYARLGEGLSDTVAAIVPEDVAAFHERIFCPDGGTFIVVGDIACDEAVTMLEARFGSWCGASDVSSSVVPRATPRSPGVYLIDRPGAAQTSIAAAMLIPPVTGLDPRALRVIDWTLGGVFSSRLNMNLREDKNWTYGVRTEITGTLGERVMTAVAPVQADRTTDSMIEILREYVEITTTRPIDEATLAMVKQSVIMGLPARCQTLGDICSTIEGLVQLGLPLDYWSDYADRMNNLTLGEVLAAAQAVVRPDALVWIVAGDRALIEGDIRRGGFGPIHILEPHDDTAYR